MGGIVDINIKINTDPEETMSQYPALENEVVTERHARMCREQGHATHTIAGVVQGTCPRCGETTSQSTIAEYIARVWASMDARNMGPTDGVTVAVEGTGGGCEAIVIRFAGHVVAVTDGNQGLYLTGGPEDVAVLHTSNAWDDGDEGYVSLWEASPENVARRIMNLMITDDEHDDEWSVPAPMLTD